MLSWFTSGFVRERPLNRHALKSGGDVEGPLVETKHELDQVLKTLRTAIDRDEEADDGNGNGKLPDDLSDRLDALKVKLEEYDTEAETLLDDIVAEVRGTEVAAPLSDLGKRLGDYDFEGAVAELVELRERIGI